MIIKSKLRDYSVSFYDDVSTLVQSLPTLDVMWIVDDNVRLKWCQHFPKYRTFISNEQNKSFENLSNLIDWFVISQVKKTTKIIAVGGGTLQDAVGFVCSIYNRGINWILVPTTLLSQVDSCIGGKTSCNYNHKKNILGTFYPPIEIKICKDFLSTLSQEHYKSGMGEIIKFYALRNELHLMPSDIQEQIKYSLDYKKKLIELDEFDRGERVFLNFGHTFGHALESISNYEIPHGIAVLLGMLIANRYATNMKMLSIDKEKEIKEVIKPWICGNIKKDWFKFDDLLAIVKSDKKNTNLINMVLLSDNVGWSPVLTPIENFLVLEKSLKEVYDEII